MIALVLACLGMGGCVAPSTVETLTANPVIIPNQNFEEVWTQTVVALDRDFEIASENRITRQIVTNPRVSPTLFEPWRGDAVGFQPRLESTLQTIRRFAIATINPDPSGGFAVRVEVYKELEDLARPDRQSGGRQVFQDVFPIDRTQEIVEPFQLPSGWIPKGRDALLEQRILQRIREAFFL